jgi:uncharacterized oligopeptide transporter (OPT) family protein
MASVAAGVFGAGLPWGMIGGGVLVGAAIIGVDEWLKHIGSMWRAPVLAVAVGIYLPLELSVPILLGGVISQLAARKTSGSAASEESGLRHGMLFAAGLITGEALIGIFMAVPIVVSNDQDVLALDLAWPETLSFVPAIIGLCVIAAIMLTLYRVATTAKSQPTASV